MTSEPFQVDKDFVKPVDLQAFREARRAMQEYRRQLKALAVKNGWGEQHPFFLAFDDMCMTVQLLNTTFQLLKIPGLAKNERFALMRDGQKIRAELEELVREAEPILQQGQGEIDGVHRSIFEAARTIVQDYPKDMLR